MFSRRGKERRDLDDTPEFRLVRARERCGFLEAIAAAVLRRDEVLRTIADARNVEDARAALMVLLDIGELPATAVLDVPLRRFAPDQRQRLEDELAELRTYIREHNAG